MEVFVFFPQLKGSSVPRSRPKCTLPKLYNRCSLSVSVKHATRLSPPLRAGHFAGGTRVVFLGRSAPPRALITVAIHPRAYAHGILAHTSKQSTDGGRTMLPQMTVRYLRDQPCGSAAFTAIARKKNKFRLLFDRVRRRQA